MKTLNRISLVLVACSVAILASRSDTNSPPAESQVQEAKVTDPTTPTDAIDVSGGTNITWRFTPGESNQVISFTISTNLSTNWVIVQTNRFEQKQVGFVSTNRILTLEYRKGVSPIILDVLGQEEWPNPATKRTVPIRQQR